MQGTAFEAYYKEGIWVDCKRGERERIWQIRRQGDPRTDPCVVNGVSRCGKGLFSRGPHRPRLLCGRVVMSKIAAPPSFAPGAPFIFSVRPVFTPSGDVPMSVEMTSPLASLDG